MIGSKGPRVGDPAPDFEVEGTEGRFQLSDQRGERVVLLFYPGDTYVLARSPRPGPMTGPGAKGLGTQCPTAPRCRLGPDGRKANIAAEPQRDDAAGRGPRLVRLPDCPRPRRAYSVEDIAWQVRGKARLGRAR
jgi:AhpC/TSA family